MTINEGLKDIPTATERIWIYSDGSAATHGHRTGSYAAAIYPGSGKPMEFIVGACSSAKTGRMEISAVNHALYHVRTFVLGGICLGNEVQIITDSEYVVLGATTPGSRKNNRDLWAQFDVLTQGLAISIDHLGRNQEPPQGFADAMCHQLRKRLEWFLTAATGMAEFGTLSITRTLNIPDDGSRQL